jgi:sterol 24-C-methyltransferase
MGWKVPELVRRLGGKLNREETAEAADEYTQYFANGDEKGRKSAYFDVVNKYYDLATSFYEYGWGESFHFAHRFACESLSDSLTRHEHFIALKLSLRPTQQARLPPRTLLKFFFKRIKRESITS